ncbi:avirulence D protein (AvrD) [Streptomyces sp. TLI_55]|uniref:AvrD family protein n=1 Tax=Streptomyces sp. TLI_55 TaxID=1938861 RepID=UPI000BD1A101|nr:AvrD family protein [Streptomyces sp. TLI_55]SNX66042.1 avirulence D protein (AvrD) [Streptomyces sp. TLI_55]
MTGPAGARLSVAAIDDYLGPGEHRYFGAGFRRVRHRLEAIRVSRRPDSTEATAHASVTYPAHWSAKGTGELLPHLSSVDTLALGAQLAEILLGHAYGLDAGARSRMWLRAVSLRAGVHPQEDLADIPVHGVFRPAESERVADGLLASSLDVRIGSMEVRCEIQHEVAGGYRPDRAEARHPSAEDALGEPCRRYFAELFRHRDQRVTHLTVDRDARRVDATVRITPAPGESDSRPRPTGLESAYLPSASMIDAITVTGQLAQVLLYELDGIDRGDSDTLWLRKAALSTRMPLRALDQAFPVHARIEDTRLLIIADDTWRVCELGYAFHGITGRFSVAHRLPDRGPR